MTGRERITAVLNKQQVLRLTWTTLVDGHTLSSLPAEMQGMSEIDFERFLGCDKTQTVEQLEGSCAEFVRFVEGLPIVIREGEEIVGARTELPFAVECSENVSIGYTSVEAFASWLPPSCPDKVKDAVHCGLIAPAGGGHWIGGYSEILQLGLRYFLAKTRNRLASLIPTEEDFRRKRVFLECLAKSYQAVIDYAQRYSAALFQHSKQATTACERERLRRLSQICRAVPADAASSFHEAIQSFWFLYLLAPDGQGRLDQFLYPYYQADVASGRMEKKRAKLLIDELIEKVNYHLASPPKIGSSETLTIGGQREDGSDATNELTYLILEVIREKPRVRPNVYVRWHPLAPPALLREALRTLRAHGGQPAIYGDPAVVSALQRIGVPLEWALDYALAGCAELIIPGRSQCVAVAGWLNVAMMVNIAIKRSSDNIVTQFQEFEEILKAVVRESVNLMVEATQRLDESAVLNWPAFTAHTLFTEGCIEAARPYIEGVAPFRSSQVLAVGIANAADALYAIRDVVFRQEEIRLEELKQALDANFQGYEKLRQRLHALPKFGNDNEDVDGLAVQMLRAIAEEFDRHNTYRGGRYALGVLMGIENMHIAFGKVTGATTDGRYAGLPLADSIGPSQGSARNGPTAAIRSVTRLDYNLLGAGAVFNIRFSATDLDQEETLEKIARVIETYLRLGGMQIQPVLVDVSTLKDARQHPERYRDLVVRVVGYSARFTELCEEIQDEVIARSEYRI